MKNANSDLFPTVVHLPDWSDANPYQKLLANGIETNQWRVIFADYPAGPIPLKRLVSERPDIKAIHLHWIAPYIENIFWGRSLFRFYAKSLLIVIDILWCRLKKIPVIWTIHNRISHESKNADREKKVRKLIAIFCNHLIFHSEGAKEAFFKEVIKIPENKTSIIPHGNYIGVYPESDAIHARLKKDLEIEDKHRVILFFGAIRHYKGIPRLIEAFAKNDDPNVRLIIAGSPFDTDLEKTILEAAEWDSRIKPYLKFIPDEEVAPLHSLANVVALPFEKTLTSGSVLLAMSLGKALILPQAAEVLGIIDHKGALFFKDIKTLTSCLQAEDREKLSLMGDENLMSAKKLRWDQIGRETSKLYN